MQHVKITAMKMNLLDLIETIFILWFGNQKFANLYELFFKSYYTEEWVWRVC